MIEVTDDDVRRRLEAFFATYPKGAGAQWIAGHLGLPRERVDAGCEALGAERVEIKRKGEKGKPAEVEIYWRKRRVDG